MDDAIEAMRRFNRFYTHLVGALDAGFLGTDVTLPEARLLFEIAMREPVLATMLREVLGLDAGYLSRLVARFEAQGWIARDRGTDARARPIRLTDAGRALFDTVDTAQREAVAARIARLDAVGRADLARAMARVRLLLDPGDPAPAILRPFRTGDMGMIAARQSILYADSHGWGRALEAGENETVAAFLRRFDPAREQCWVAEIDGVMAGSVFLTDESETAGEGTGRLRLLYVEPFARRRGVGDMLVGACVGFARDKGYRRVTLWTHTVLAPARRLYARHGFVLVASAEHHEFGVPVDGETWELDLATG